MEKLITVREAAKVLSTTERTLRQWIYQKDVPFVRVRGNIRFRPSELEVWLKKQNRKKGDMT